MNPEWVVPVDPPRPLTAEERRLLTLLLRPNFPGAAALREQLAGTRVSGTCRDGCGSVMLTVDPAITARYAGEWRAPVSLVGTDIDGVPIEVLIHVLDGKLAELEIVRFDYEHVKQMPADAAFRCTFPERTADGKVAQVEDKYR
jgi:hypothetical protein